MKKSYVQNNEPMIFSQEELFEKLILQWKKDSKDRLNDIAKNENRKRPDKKHRLSPFRFEQ